MPVDQEMEFTWPIFRHAFKTTGAEPVSIVIADAPLPGDVVAIPELYVCGRTRTAALGNVQLGGYTLRNTSGTAALSEELENTNTIGGGGLVISLAVVGTELRLVMTGIALTEIIWGIYWRCVDFPEVEIPAP